MTSPEPILSIGTVARSRPTGEVITAPWALASVVIRQRCGRPAPLVVNGGAFVGCALDPDHEPPCETTVRWT